VYAETRNMSLYQPDSVVQVHKYRYRPSESRESASLDRAVAPPRVAPTQTSTSSLRRKHHCHRVFWNSMSLYHEAAAILDSVGKGQTSLKTEVFGRKTWKSDQKTLFALTSEAAKWSSVLKEVVEKSKCLGVERTVGEQCCPKGCRLVTDGLHIAHPDFGAGPKP